MSFLNIRTWLRPWQTDPRSCKYIKCTNYCHRYTPTIHRQTRWKNPWTGFMR